MSHTRHPYRRSNQRLVFDQVRGLGTASRAQLARLTELSAPTVGKVADQLLSLGLLEEPDLLPASLPDASALGRPSRPLRLNASQPRLITLQIGANNTRLACLPVAGPADEQWPIQFRTPARLPAFLDRLTDAARLLTRQSPTSRSPSRPRPWAAAVSVPGAVDESTGHCLLSPNLPWLHDADLAAHLQPIFPDTPLCFVQEIRALALGHLRAAPDLESFILIDFGEGVGGAIISHGRLYDPPLPLSGELGHTRVLGNTRACGCGAVGCLETLVSRRGLIASLAEKHHAHHAADHSWKTLIKHVATHGIEPWLAGSLEAAGATIGSAMNLLGVRHAVITGALTELPPAVMQHLADSVRSSAMWARFGQVTCTPAPRRRAAGLVVAAVDRILLPNLHMRDRRQQ